MMRTSRELHERLGLRENPFAQTNADLEPHLSKYFLPPKFFAKVVGDPNSPASVIVLASRGGGKSAQRRQLELHSEKRSILCLTYDEFDRHKDITIDDHIESIVRRLLISLLVRLQADAVAMELLDRSHRRALLAIAHRYLGGLDHTEFRETLQNLRSLPTKLIQVWNRSLSITQPLLEVLTSRLGLPSLELRQLTEDTRSLAERPKAHFKRLVSIATKAGFKAVYILVDKVDENERTGSSPTLAYRFIRPLLTELDLLELRNCAFKFFLWNKLREKFDAAVRTDRVPQFDVRWSTDDLEILLERRIRAFAIPSQKNRLRTFDDLLLDSPSTSFHRAICMIAASSPRSVIRICGHIFAFQDELAPRSRCISPSAVQQGIDLFCDEAVRDRYQVSALTEFKKIGQGAFTKRTVAGALTHLSKATVGARLKKWESLGAVRRLGKSPDPITHRLVSYYCVCDPALLRTIFAKSLISDFVMEHEALCNLCGARELLDLTAIQQYGEPVCPQCGSEYDAFERKLGDALSNRERVRKRIREILVAWNPLKLPASELRASEYESWISTIYSELDDDIPREAFVLKLTWLVDEASGTRPAAGKVNVVARELMDLITLDSDKPAC